MLLDMGYFQYVAEYEVSFAASNISKCAFILKTIFQVAYTIQALDQFAPFLDSEKNTDMK